MEFIFNNQKYELILFTLAGSRFYGTHFDGKGTQREHPLIPDYVSDSDFRGVFIAPPETKVGLTNSIDLIEVKTDGKGNISKEHKELIKELNQKLNLNMTEDEDIALYEIKKFIDLSLLANPNIMDLLFSDEDAIFYSNEKGQELLQNRDIFLSKKTKFTFSGYALSQVYKARSHFKMLTQYPKVNVVIHLLQDAYEKKEIDYNWITDHFGGKLSSFITKKKQEKASEEGKQQSISWEEFVKRATVVNPSEDEISANELNKYRKPQAIDYCVVKDLKAHRLGMEEGVFSLDGQSALTKEDGTILEIKEFLFELASFRTISKTQFNIFTPPDEKYNGGLFARNGKIKSNDPKEVGDFVFQMSFNENDFKKDTDAIAKLWEWRTKRNEKRSILEEKFGYDTKHLSHTIRLLIGGANILKTGEYHPRLSGDNLKLVREVLSGKFTYDEVIAMATKAEEELDTLYETCTLPHSANFKKANKLLLKLSL